MVFILFPDDSYLQKKQHPSNWHLFLFALAAEKPTLDSPQRLNELLLVRKWSLKPVMEMFCPPVGLVLWPMDKCWSLLFFYSFAGVECTLQTAWSSYTQLGAGTVGGL